MNLKMPTLLANIVMKLQSVNARALLIGGGVIDSIQNLPIKDWDIEVYNISYESLLNVLSEFGKPNLVGKSFGIIKLDNYDFSIPRTENRCGVGHKDFDIVLNSDLSPEEAGRRRDLTINSMYLDLATMELTDPFNGQQDLKDGVLRATDPTTFVEDPLRVLRIMQLLPRKGKIVDPNTIDLCKSMVNEFGTIPRERIFEEFKKLLLLSNKPSLGLEFLKNSGWLIQFPELYNLIGCKQNPNWHPEGDAWQHTLAVVDIAAYTKNLVPEKDRFAFMLAALLHDVGKPSTTDPISLTSYGHDIAGVELCKEFMRRITNEVALTLLVVSLVREHMQIHNLMSSSAKIPAWKRLHNRSRLDILAYLSMADSVSTGRHTIDTHAGSKVALEYYKMFGNEPIQPAVLGRHLISRGFTPGPSFREILKRAYEYQIENNENDPEIILNKIIS